MYLSATKKEEMRLRDLFNRYNESSIGKLVMKRELLINSLFLIWYVFIIKSML